ncbi:MAG TPA: rhamnogalacturonan lyase B N-terminal domain-containing protein [Verrucomicrobiae bacterium]|nr:rhamnogalacturonan lyase B N-terminal domain-containing protein [Verrucomicrobiae bacterium]
MSSRWRTAQESIRRCRLALFVLALAAGLLISGEVRAAFGLTTAADYYQVDTGAGLVFKVRRTDNGSSTQSAGDLMSLVYNGVEYQDQSRGSQINSGFDWIYNYTNLVTVSATVYGTNHLKITVVSGDPASGQGVLTHYYLARNGDPVIYMATHFTQEPEAQALCRFIVRIPSSLLPNGPPPSDIRNNTGAIESGDIFGMADGTTRSKHYSNMRLLDWAFIGATGNNVGVFMDRSSHEGDSGGPFYRSLLNQCGTDQEITYIINYGEGQTEPFRTNILNGPYALVFTGGGLPETNLDYSWIETGGLNLVGWVPAAGRGIVKGTVAGVPAGFQPVVGFANEQAQYWTVAGTNGGFTSLLMLPGTYTATLYKQELAVATAPVSVSAGMTNTLNLVSTAPAPTFIWKLGEWDGTPAGLLNADRLTTMHPSDVRMSNWAPWPFVIESNSASQFPCVQFRGTNSPAVIQFNLAANQITPLTLRLGTTCAYNGGRPQITVNSWNSSYSGAPSQPKTRSITVGTYRENNYLYTFNIPASALVVGQNTLQINPVSGSGDLGPWLSASWAYDCLELDGPVANAPSPPIGLAARPDNARVVLTWSGSPAAASYNVKRSGAAGGPFITIASGVPAPVYTDATVTNGVPYYYVVSAVNVAGESGNSSVVTTHPFDLYAHWTFDETDGSTAADDAGTNAAALGSGANWVAGKSGNAVHLDGTANGFVRLPTGVVSNLNDFTIAAWVKLDTLVPWSRVFDFGSGTGTYMFLTPASYGGNTVRYAITRRSNGSEEQINCPTVLTTGVWHHVAVTLTGPVGILYVDGAPVGTNSAMTLRPSTLGNTVSNYLGRSQWSDPGMAGAVDELRIYNRALSAAEISQLTVPPAAPANLMALAGDAQVELQWTTAPNAASYHVKRAPAPAGPYTTLTNVAGTSVVSAPLTNGTLYYFTVSALNVAGESADSAPVAARPVSASPPQLGVTANAGQLQLLWPSDHTGWVLQAQTNAPGAGLGTNWFILSDSTQTNRFTLPFDPAHGSLFFRLRAPY